ncbi:hypothetical protein [Nocardia sp. NPDC052112]|uniref:hypothetical protein n=1 Tax=Nocardia sp. NPDC052112 TaxID=3155646 RepID=UPI00341B2BC9
MTLAKRKSDHTLIGEATASWWPGTSCSAWVVLTRSGVELTAAVDGFPLPALAEDRSEVLRSAWDTTYPGQARLQFEALVYEIKRGRQISVKYQLIP